MAFLQGLLWSQKTQFTDVLSWRDKFLQNRYLLFGVSHQQRSTWIEPKFIILAQFQPNTAWSQHSLKNFTWFHAYGVDHPKALNRGSSGLGISFGDSNFFSRHLASKAKAKPRIPTPIIAMSVSFNWTIDLFQSKGQRMFTRIKLFFENLT